MFAIQNIKENRLLGLGCILQKIHDGPDIIYTLDGSTSIWISDTAEDAEDVIINGPHYDNPWDNAEDRPYHTYPVDDLKVVALEMLVLPKGKVEVFSLGVPKNTKVIFKNK
jgi:hypothetical protein